MIPYRAPGPIARETDSLAARRLHRIPLRSMVANLRALYDLATPEQISAGLNWYARAHSIAREIGEACGRGVETGAAILAALSPRAEWGGNVRAAWSVARGEQNIGMLAASVDKARRIAAGADPESTLAARGSGFKIRAFYACILDPIRHDAPVCVDSHGIGAAIGRAPSKNEASAVFGSARLYARFASAFEKACPAGLPVREFQAIVWCVWRELPRAIRF